MAYWEKMGAEQAKLDEMENSGWEFSQKMESIFNSYYRYFNDGDFPGWARGKWNLRKTGRWGWELNEKGLELQEQRVTEAVLAEYKRFTKAKLAKFK